LLNIVASLFLGLVWQAYCLKQSRPANRVFSVAKAEQGLTAIFSENQDRHLGQRSKSCLVRFHGLLEQRLKPLHGVFTAISLL
jgi:hypothetical protein